MAATSSSRANLVNQLRASRTSSPRNEEYTTAASFDPTRDEALHSTVQLQDWTTQQTLPRPPAHAKVEDDQLSDEMSGYGSEGSAEMSIEFGRGVKREAREAEKDHSYNPVFNLGNDSLYEVTGTPQIASRAMPRKPVDGLRRQASIRRATETAKRAATAPGLKHRSLSEALQEVSANVDSSFRLDDDEVDNPTSNARNTRFTRARQASVPGNAVPSRPASASFQNTPRRVNNSTVQSNSFILPDLPNITELVLGVRKDGTPLFGRRTKSQSRSRFTSGSYNSNQHQHPIITSVPIPVEEKAIYSSLQLLKDRVEQLEMEKSEAQKHAEECDGEIIDLRSQLATSLRRPDSGFGSDEDSSSKDKLTRETVKLQASVKALQDRLERSERKVSLGEISTKRVIRERDELVKQIGVAYYSVEELKVENEAYRESQSKLRFQKDQLEEEVALLKKANHDLRVLAGQTRSHGDKEGSRRKEKHIQSQDRLGRSQDTREAKESVYNVPRPGAEMQPKSGKARLNSDLTLDGEIAIIKEAALEQVRAKLASENPATKSQEEKQDGGRSRSKSATRRSAVNQDRLASGRAAIAKEDAAQSDAESTTQLDFTPKPRNASKRASLPNVAKTRPPIALEEDSRDFTLLSWQDPEEVAKLRKKLEEEKRSGKLGRAVSAPAETDATETARALPRKSSLKDITAGSEHVSVRTGNVTGRSEGFAKIAKSVRVQSPHTSDASIHHRQQAGTDDISILSNMSRRRRRAASAEGMTSAFILPDITLHGKLSVATSDQAANKHDPDSCTACASTEKEVTIPLPVPVTEREDLDVTNATVRPSQAPALALATVLKQLEDEVRHLKLRLADQQRAYAQHDPALSKRTRQTVRARIEKLTAEIEKRSDQIYALYDVLEGQKDIANAAASRNAGDVNHVLQDQAMSERAVEDTLESHGLDPLDFASRIARADQSTGGLDGQDDWTEDLPGFSDGEEQDDAAKLDRRLSEVY